MELKPSLLKLETISSNTTTKILAEDVPCTLQFLNLFSN